jgi:lipopolysaccharide/colanic/teichoic acid biosynthesis glycosyltransferase
MNQGSGKNLSQAFLRSFDVICSAAGLLLLLPVFVGVATAIILDDGPPILFSQARVGRNGKLFKIWKFRTMRRGSQGSAVTAAGDCRITRAGARLRKYKLDELPQLFNVLKGEMSLIGPRPEVPEYVQLQAPMWQAVLQARPGITDLATLLYRDEERLLAASRDPNGFYRESVLPAKLLLNLAYLLSRSFWQDLKLIFLTIRFSLFPQGFHPDLVKRSFGAGVRNE